MTTVAEITLATDADAWRRIGLPLDAEGVARVGSVNLRLEAPTDRTGITSWVLVGAPSPDQSIDGLLTRHLDAPPVMPVPSGPDTLGAVSIDHLVINTSDLDRTCGTVAAATGAPLKRVRDLGAVRQGFHRLGEVILEVVERPDVTVPHAEFWGLVLNVADLDAVAARLGPDVVSPPKGAVQPGRRIATFRVEAGLGLPVALMTP